MQDLRPCNTQKRTDACLSIVDQITRVTGTSLLQNNAVVRTCPPYISSQQLIIYRSPSGHRSTSNPGRAPNTLTRVLYLRVCAATGAEGRCERDSYDGDVPVQGVRSGRGRYLVRAKLAVLPPALARSSCAIAKQEYSLMKIRLWFVGSRGHRSASMPRSFQVIIKQPIYIHTRCYCNKRMQI